MNDLEITKNEIQEFQNIYSPSTLLGVYATALHTPADGKIVLARGIYQQTPNQKEYSGYFYDTIKSPNENKSIRIKISGLLRSKLENNIIYIFKGYIEKKINFSAIELVLVVDDILKKEENQITEEEIKRFELLQKKIVKGFRDFESIVKEHIHNNKVLRIANIYGTTAIVHKDFEKGLAESVTRFDISSYRCNLASISEVISTIKKINLLGFDVIALVRGGGDKASLEIFNDSELGNEALNLTPILVTALGHAMDETLLDKIADKKFAVPFDYGNSLKVLVDQAIDEQAKSKSLFIDQVKNDLEKTFKGQIATLTIQLTNKNKEYEEAQKNFNEFKKSLEDSMQKQISAASAELKVKYDYLSSEKERLNKQLDKALKANNKIIIYVIIAAIIGLIIGLLA
jgi:exodeoxyribonuclease VII large subunit